MEVLISIGILAVGLSSVVALVPAGKSEAAKAVMLDRGANLAMNALNDSVTYGITRPHSFLPQPAGSSLVTFDLLDVSGSTSTWTNSVSGTPKTAGIFALKTSTTCQPNLLYGLLQGRDDLAYTAAANDDDPPFNLFTNGVRSFQGRTTALLSLAPMAGTLGVGSPAKLTAVVFHNRILSAPSDAVITGTYNAGGTISPVASAASDRSFKEIIRPGTVVYSPTSPVTQAWYQVAMASPDESERVVYVTFVGDVEPPIGSVVQIALDSIGLAERIVTLEGSGPYGR
jgi:hypothetical protein